MWWQRKKSQTPQDLYERLLAFRLDKPGAPFPFSARLAKEQGWTQDFAELAIQEYKRFMYLSVVAVHPVTPSLVVDEVWHLHLIYTRSYWDEFCLGLLGKLVHHDPGSGESEEKTHFFDQYARTLQSYRLHIGEPPQEIWGPDNGKAVKKHGL